MVITVSVECCNGGLGIGLLVVMNKSKPFTLAGHLVLGQVNTGDVTKRLKEFLKISEWNFKERRDYF